jgi:DNA mismatch repair ATPase MutS
MKARLLYRGQDFDWRPALQAAEVREATRADRQYRGQDFDRRAGLPWNEAALSADLALNTLFNAMARDDNCIFEVARRVVLAGVNGDLTTIRYRQRTLQDCLNHPAVVRDLYAVAIEAVDMQKRHYLGSYLARYPDHILRHSIELMLAFLELQKKLRKLADSHAYKFVSEGWSEFFATLKRELDDEYFARAQHHLEQLKFRNGVLLSAALGSRNKGSDYILRRFPQRKGTWLELWRDCLDTLRRHLPNREETCPTWLRPRKSPVYSFSLHPRDESGARALAELRNRGIGLVADALAQSTDHVRDFFGMLQAELAFYVGCVNLHEQLARKGEPICLPQPAAAEERRLSFRGLCDVCLTLNLNQRVVGNDVDADKKDLVIVTGANQGGKSTFLRSVGLAQLMMQCGMFVPADYFCSSVCDGLFSHYKREEDPGMRSGKLDEELSRMSDIVGHITSHSLILFNEPFAATNEREGSEIARQIMTALLDKRVRIVCVTHLYELAHEFYDRNIRNALFLRAERTRTFKLLEGEPLPTSFGEDLYKGIFVADVDRFLPDSPKIRAAAPVAGEIVQRQLG